MEIYTIGFTKKSAAEFFRLLKVNDIRRIVDIRLSNSGQLAGFTKQDDLQFFLSEICDADYVHEPMLAPTKELLSSYRDKQCSWAEYERVFDGLMQERCIDENIDRSLFAQRSALLCSEPTADQCHRRLVAEYLQRAWGNVDIVHL
ncbi:MAG TPA: DUF488 domain-containing protein [Thermomicrobiales bacterium]|nr:DUF488 domain-containing protein [Thermomicrobiales bacterium]